LARKSVAEQPRTSERLMGYGSYIETVAALPQLPPAVRLCGRSQTVARFVENDLVNIGKSVVIKGELSARVNRSQGRGR
jgi:hypothetical protein